MTSPSSKSTFSPGFSLLELLVVLTVTAILIGLAVPGISSMNRGYQLSATGDLLVAQLNLARQAALSNGHLVQVRLYHLPDYNSAPSASRTTFRGIQCFLEGDPIASGTPPLTPLTKPVFFAAPVIISTVTSPILSPLLSSTMYTATTTDPTLPLYGSSYDYCSFHFRPNGTTDLGTSANSVTLVMENDKSAATGLPNNYRTVQIDPAVGTSRSFAP
jgi:uncharacterized protein (TIGR02596 family)